MVTAQGGVKTALVTPVIMCGGAGTRLWPLSTANRPKQLHALSTDLTLLQETALRGAGEAQGVRFTAPIVVCAAAHADEIARQLKAVGVEPAALVVEPVPRSTAPVAAAAARLVSRKFPGALMLLLPADHVVPDVAGFRAVLAKAAAAAVDHIVTLGVTPDAPETGFGYIKRGAPIGEGVTKVERFVEKPDRATAEGYLASGDYLWNAGVFLGSADLLVQELQTYAPDILKQTDKAIAAGRSDGVALHLDAEAFAASPENSIDYAVMEKTAHAAVAPMTTAWIDVGGWEALHAMGPHDDAQNRTRGQVLALDTSGSLIWASDRKVVVAGLKDVLVVENEGVVLVMPLAMTGSDMRRVHKAALPFLESCVKAKPVTELERVACDLNRWLDEEALPLWWAKGADHVRGGWFETLTMAGEPGPGERRARVQARQTFVYGDAFIRGRPNPGLKAVEHGLDYLLEKYRRDDGLIRDVVDNDGKPVDDTAILYTQAFALLAICTAYEAMGKPAELLDAGHELRRRVASTMRNAAGGFKETGKQPYQSNPHMHFFEACLAWESVDDDPVWTAMADEIGTLALTKFIDQEGHFLREFFDEHWNPAAGRDGEVVEPGHQFEWSWLLARWGRRRGRPDVLTAARRLFDIGVQHGVDSRGVAYDEMNLKLEPARPTARLWPQTEHIKTCLIFAELADSDEERKRCEGLAASAARALQLYLDAPLKGAWKDKLSPDGAFVDEAAPASSFYHITAAIDALADYGKKPTM